MASKNVFSSRGEWVSGYIDDDAPKAGDNYAVAIGVPHGDAPAMSVRWYLSTDRARAFAAELVAAADAVDAAVAAAQTVPLPLGDAPKAGIITALALFLGLAFGACATATAPAPVETVGQLTAARGSVMSAPVHATTDLTGGFQAVSTDAEDDTSSFSTSTEAAKEEVNPDVVAKGGGLVAGAVR